MPDHQPIQAVPVFSRVAVQSHQGSAGITIAEHHNLGIVAITLRRNRKADFAASVSAAFGLTMADGPKMSTTGEISLIGTGPDSYLAVKPATGWRFTDELRAAIGDSAAICDQSSGYGVLRLSGPNVRDVLAKGVPLDLDPAAFGPNGAAVTLAAHIGIMLWQVDSAPTYNIAVPRSMAGSFWDWLAESAAEFGLAVATPIS